MNEKSGVTLFGAGFRLWISWILITVVEVAIVAVLFSIYEATGVVYMMGRVPEVLETGEPLTELPWALLAFGVTGIIAGAGIGLPQYIIIRGRIDRPGRWIGFTALGSAIAWISLLVIPVFTLADDLSVMRAFIIAWVGGVTGLIQWWLLRRESYQPYWWPLTTLSGWGSIWVGVILVLGYSDYLPHNFLIPAVLIAGMFTGIGPVLVFDRSAKRKTNAVVFTTVALCVSIVSWLFFHAPYSEQTRAMHAPSSEQTRAMHGHTYSVTSVTFSPDGTLIASAGSEGTVKLWEVSSGRNVYTISADSVDPPEWQSSTNDFTDVAFSADGSLLAGGSNDGTARLWEAATGLELHRLQTRSFAVNSVAFSPDGRLLAAGTIFPSTVKLWDTTSGDLVRTFTASVGGIYSVAFSPNGELLAGSSGVLELWEVATGRLVRTLEGFDFDGGFKSSVAFSPDGQYIAAGGGSLESSEHACLIWDVETGMAAQDIPGPWIYGLAYSPDGRILALAHGYGVQLWDVSAERQLAILQGGSVSSLAFSPDGTLLVTGSLEGAVRVWNVVGSP